MFIFIFWVLLLSIFICAILKSLISAKALLIGIGLANIRILVTGWTAIPHISYTIIYHVFTMAGIFSQSLANVPSIGFVKHITFKYFFDDPPQ